MNITIRAMLLMIGLLTVTTSTSFAAPPTPCTTAAECNDNNPCTEDVCRSNGRCRSAALTGSSCNADGNICTTGTCTRKGVCVETNVPATPPTSCNDSNVCTENDICDGNGACLGTATPGAACNDNQPGTCNDVCQGDVCVGDPQACGICGDRTLQQPPEVCDVGIIVTNGPDFVTFANPSDGDQFCQFNAGQVCNALETKVVNDPNICPSATVCTKPRLDALNAECIRVLTSSPTFCSGDHVCTFIVNQPTVCN